MSSVTITDIPKGVKIPKTMSYNDFVEHTLKEQENFDVDLQFTDYKDLSDHEKKIFDESLKLKDSDFVNI